MHHSGPARIFVNVGRGIDRAMQRTTNGYRYSANPKERGLMGQSKSVGWCRPKPAVGSSVIGASAGLDRKGEGVVGPTEQNLTSGQQIAAAADESTSNGSVKQPKGEAARERN